MCTEHEDSTQRLLLVGHRTDSMHKNGLITTAVLTVAAMLPGQKWRRSNMQISSHAKEQQRKAVGNQPTNYALLHQQQQFLSQPSLECTSFFRMKNKKEKQQPKWALKVCSTSNGLPRYTLDMQKCMKLLQRLMKLFSFMSINALSKCLAWKVI